MFATAPFPLRSYLALMLLGPSLSLAATEPAKLADTEVTGTPIQAPLPTTTRTDAEALDKRFIRSFDDLGRRSEPGVNFNRNNESINIRGLDRDRVLTTIDGIRVPWMTDGARSQGPTGGAQGGLDAIDFNSLSAVDIVRGANSSQAGSGALGGAVQLFTLNPDDLLSEGQDFATLAKTDYDSADNSWGLNAALAGRYNHTKWLLQAGKRQGDELETSGNDNLLGAGRTEANPADVDRHNALLKLQQGFDGGHQLGFTAEYFKRENDIDTRTGQGSTYLAGENSTQEDTKRQRLSLDYDFKAQDSDGWLDRAHAITYWQKIEREDDQDAVRALDSRAGIPDFVFQMFGLPENPYKYPSGVFQRNNRIEKTLYGFTGEVGKKKQLVGLDHDFSLGGELYWIETQQASKGQDNCPANLVSPSPSSPVYMGPSACDFLHTNQADSPEAKGRQWAVYAADEISFADGVFKLTPGLRYDAYKVEPDAGGDYADNVNPNNNSSLTDSDDSKLSASLLATWQVAEQALLYAQWAQGFKAPDATQLYMNYGASGTYLRVGNPDLKPEESNGYEVGGQFGNNQLGGSLSLFDNHYKNFIDEGVLLDSQQVADLGLDAADYPFGVTRTENRDKVRIYGAEATAHWGFSKDWKLWGAVAWARGEDRKTNQDLNSVAPLTTTLGLSYEHERFGSDLMLTAASARDKVETDADFKAPGYGVVDMTAYWQPAALDGVKLQAGVFNILDKKYWNALNVPDGALVQPDDYYSEVGRSVRVSASWQY
ncbi:TonB-dependent hemoglobin/transferrin/lactoferrin family receptor [Pseudomonas segetis]|uniref:Hemoglobin/transferrin/lactoferrin receptor protein n=1 Tax=Pseudomonas segetis TaxID=298908 RepID=A0A239GLM0_9PSED|nr:TonB-dependent hemoglobin/transferrin/lactoferrin family receptor [Pseudomonas segetis]SNS69393.1 hemoglobin/transferrin/lactoferrin receptor protein [Pseudomonas segetis]